MSLMTGLTPVLALLFLAASSGFAQEASADLTERYRATAGKLIQAALADTEGYDRLAYLCYRIGNRLSVSASLEKAIAWSVEQMKAAGLSNVRVIPTKVPHWVRGAESARILTPLARQAPHTGAMEYDEAQPKIPTAAISPEDALMIGRLYSEGVTVKIHLEMGAQLLPDADSGDVIGEIPGSEHPEEIVV